MKKLLRYFSIIGVGAALTACNLNVDPTFDDNDAFVAFDKATASVSEDAKVVSIPVTLASVSGISTTISYAAVDGTAKQGKDFELADGSATLTFSAEKRTQYINVNIIHHEGVYTGDLKFSLTFKSTGDVNTSADNTCTVTITDLDHPLNFILGSYETTAESYFSGKGPWSWTVKIEKDAEDVSKVWVKDLEPYLGEYGWVSANGAYNTFYGIVNEEKTQITIPRGQLLGYDETACMMGFTSADCDEGGLADIIIQISSDGKTLTMPYAWGCAVTAEGKNWYNIIQGGVILKKK